MTHPAVLPAAPKLHPGKFKDPQRTLGGEKRAHVALKELTTLWFNTGTLCNIACANCYIESSPRNDALVYLSAEEVRSFLDEAAAMAPELADVGFTGGEPFLNRALPAMLADVLGRGLRALVLTNAMTPMRHHREQLLSLRRDHGNRLTLRVSLDHHLAALHELERGAGSFAQALEGLRWLSAHGFRVHVAARAGFGNDAEATTRSGFRDLFADHDIAVDADDPVSLMLFPEMDATADVPEISERCWSILGRHPDEVMCASARMVVRRKGDAAPGVVACTLLPYDPRFELGRTLREASRPVALNHPHCARFCVLGGAACSR